MIVCPNCNHQNPDGAVQCEACYTPLPAMTICPNCGASVQADATFCGQCGFNLQSVSETATTQAIAPASVASTNASPTPPSGDPAASGAASSTLAIPELLPMEPLIQPEPLLTPSAATEGSIAANSSLSPASSEPVISESLSPEVSLPPSPPPLATPASPPSTPSSPPHPNHTQLQTQTARLLHIQTNNLIELSSSLALIHIGKPNDRIPPDIDVSGFPNSEIVSRVHADIRVEGDSYFIEDVGSSNGTYINNTPLPPGNRHRLRIGDRIALGKGDKVSFLFQMS